MIHHNRGHSKCLHSSCNRLVFWLERKRSNKSIGIELWRIGVACLRREVMRRSTGIAQWTWQLTISIQNRNRNIDIINNKARYNRIDEFLPNWMIFFHFSSTWFSDQKKIVFSADHPQFLTKSVYYIGPSPSTALLPISLARIYLDISDWIPSIRVHCAWLVESRRLQYLHRIITIIIKDSKERKNLEKDWIPSKL